MAMGERVEPVVSGVPYEVVSMNGEELGSADRLLADEVSLVLRAGARELSIEGTAARTDETGFLFYEKSTAGKDVRTWTVDHDENGHLVLIERSIF